MRNAAYLLLLVLLCLIPASAKDSPSASQRKLKGYLQNLVDWENQARPIEPLLSLAENRTGAQQREIERRYDVLYQMMENKVKPLMREVSQYRSQVDPSLALPAQSVEDTVTSFSGWLDAKLTLQNAGAKNPGLPAIRNNEKTAYAEYQTRLKAAREALK